jgi:hypothetical protein
MWIGFKGFIAYILSMCGWGHLHRSRVARLFVQLFGVFESASSFTTPFARPEAELAARADLPTESLDLFNRLSSGSAQRTLTVGSRFFPEVSVCALADSGRRRRASGSGTR